MGRMVLGAVCTPVPDVLGRPFGLPFLSFRRAPGASGQSHHPKSARSAVHQYRDELHVSQRGVVVLLHVNPVLFDLSPALLVGAPRRTVVERSNKTGLTWRST